MQPEVQGELQLLVWRSTNNLCELLMHGRTCSHAQKVAGFVQQCTAVLPSVWTCYDCSTMLLVLAQRSAFVGWSLKS